MKIGPLAATSLVAILSLPIACGGSEAVVDAAPAATTPDGGSSRPPVEVDAGTTVTCPAPAPIPSCATTKAAPTSSSAITQFVKDVAVPIRCTAGADDAWDLRTLVDRYGDQKIFMLGEVHGTNEIGILSSLIFDELARKKLANVVGYELPMDYEPYLQRYVDTGNDETASQLVGVFAKNFFGNILTRRARELVEAGFPIHVAAVDIPVDPNTAANEIRKIAEKLTTQKEKVLTTLPSFSGEPTPEEIEKINAYYDAITGDEAAICAELSSDDCDRLDAMTHGMWASAMRGSMVDDSETWFARREVLIYYNMHHAMKPSDRMFLHMGAAHTNKASGSGGSRMAKEWPATKGKVFSIAPAWNDGSVIDYGGEMDLPADPASIAAALGDAKHPAFVSITQPNEACEGNPVGEEPEENGFAERRADAYDGYLYYGRLTPENRPNDATIAGDSTAGRKRGAGEALVRFRAQIVARERAYTEARSRRVRGMVTK